MAEQLRVRSSWIVVRSRPDCQTAGGVIALWTKPPKTNTHEWARSIALLLAMPAFFVLMGVFIHSCGGIH
jgi:hypothetical protein